MSSVSLRSSRVRLLLLCLLFGACVESSGAVWSPPMEEAPRVTARELPDDSRPLTQRSGAGFESIQPKIISEDLATLTQPAWQGRATGTDGVERAAQFLEESLRGFGVKPAGDNGTYRHTFEVQLGVNILPETSLSDSSGLSLSASDFTPLASSQNGEIQERLVFVGYGRGSNPFGVSDYKDVSVKGKIAVILREFPVEAGEHFSGPNAFTWYQVFTAQAAGAKAILFVSGVPGARRADDELPSLARAGRVHASKLLLAQVKRYVLASWLASDGGSLDITPRELPIRVTLKVKIEPRRIKQHNIVGLIEGAAPQLPPLVLGAHYDHIGHDLLYSRATAATEAAHLGADDNASGTAAVLSLAYALMTSQPKRSVLVCFFAAEELGLLGSQAFVQSREEPARELFAMLNLDMVGRLDGALAVLAADSSPRWPALLAKANDAVHLTLRPRRDTEGRSDHASFLRAKVPSLLFFTGFHEDYHAPSDTREKINVEGLAQITRLVFSLIAQLDEIRAL